MFTFVESAVFAAALPVYLDDEEYSDLQQFMMSHPEAGRVVPGSGGVRKLRWGHDFTGKRGGLRIIYYVRYRPNEFWMLTLYSKSRQANIPSKVLKRMKELFEK